MKTNKVLNVNFFGGIMGLINSPRKRLEQAVNKANADGWSVRQILPGSLNPLFLIFSFIILFVTLLIYMPLPGYMVVLEKEQ